MRIGIVTPFDSRNFGNRLQNYALQQILLPYADEVITIKNKPCPSNLLRRLQQGTSLAESIPLNRLLGETQKAAILEFNRAHLRVSRNLYWCNRNYKTLKQEERCDWYCAGSDQIWNPDLHREDGFNFLTFAPKERTFSYAASFGVDTIPEEKQRKVSEGLHHIRYLSVREETGAKLTEQLTGRQDVFTLPDPTLLLSREEWDKVRKVPSAALPERYLLSLFLGPRNEKRTRQIQQKANRQGWNVIAPLDHRSPFYGIGPGELLHILQGACLVCTDSFHMSVFSFLYQRPLVIFRREGEGSTMASRLDTLVKTYHLESCLARGDSLPPIPEKADYSRGFFRLEQERLRAKAYLDGIFHREDAL